MSMGAWLTCDDSHTRPGAAEAGAAIWARAEEAASSRAAERAREIRVALVIVRVRQEVRRSLERQRASTTDVLTDDSRGWFQSPPNRRSRRTVAVLRDLRASARDERSGSALLGLRHRLLLRGGLGRGGL